MKITNASFRGLLLILVLNLVVVACSPTSPTPVNVPATQPPATEIPAGTSTPDLSNLPLVVNPSLAGFEMLDSLNGWGVTDTSLVRTVDGGVTWVDITPSGVSSLGYAANVYFLNPLTGWLVIAAPDYINGTIFHTSDGGLNWTFLPVPFSGGMIDFINASTGFILVSRGAAAGSSAVDVYSTSDGGTTWTPVYIMQPGAADNVNTLPFGGQKSGFTFLDSTHGWVGGSIPMDGVIYLYSSIDGGQTWGKQSVNLPTGYETSMTEVGSARFFNEKDGFLPVRIMKDASNLDFYITHDGGVTWSATTPVSGTGKYSIISLEDIISWDGGQYLHVSHDSGQSWNNIATNVNVTDTLMKFDFVDALTGWMLTGDANNQHTFYKTLDGGVTWTVLIP
jgi:photosystem II stability/assembly factor-like uncharacterized protein